MVISVRFRMALSFALSFCLATAAARGESSPGESKPKGDSEFLHQVQDLSNRLLGLKSYSVTIPLKQIVHQESGKQEYAMTCRLSFQRPGAFFLDLRMESPLFTFVSDGKTLFIHSGNLEQYTEESAPATVDALLEGPDANDLLVESFTPLLFVLSGNPQETLLKHIESGQTAGEEKIADKTARRLKIRHTDFDWEIWTGTGETEFPVKRMVITVNPPADSGQPRVEIVWEFQTESLNGELPATTFQFSPPPGSRKARYLGDEGPHPLEGKPAPDFSLEFLDGTKKKLSELKGKIVVLDFWASWCGPCRRGLPMIEEIMQTVDSSAGVSFAVNQGETDEEIQSFLQKTGLKLTVAKDGQGEIGNLYLVKGIPQTVLIDREGIVRHVHAGLSPFFQSVVKKQISQLLRKPAPPSAPSAAAP